MEWATIIALLVAIPMVLFPVVFIWYLNIGGILETRKRQEAWERAIVEIKKY